MRVFNFSAGPAAMPEEVLRQAAEEMLDWRGSGMSVMEMSHRGREFMSIHEEALVDLRDLLEVPASHHILFMQGGGVGRERDRADEHARLEARRRISSSPVRGRRSRSRRRQKYCTPHLAASGETSRRLHARAAPARAMAALGRSGLRSPMHERDHRRCRDVRDSRSRRHSARWGRRRRMFFRGRWTSRSSA